MFSKTVTERDNNMYNQYYNNITPNAVENEKNSKGRIDELIYNNIYRSFLKHDTDISQEGFFSFTNIHICHFRTYGGFGTK